MSHLNIKTLLNVKEKFKGFVFKNTRLIEKNNMRRIEVDVVARKGSKGQCAQCGSDGPTYDHLPQREFLYVPLWGITVYLLYCMRRINCKNCDSLKTESVPWSDGKSPITISMMWYLSELAKILSWAGVAKLTKTTWHHIYTSVAHTVGWGRERVNLDGITALGIDEVFWGKGKCATVVYQIDNHRKRLLYIVEKRTKESINGFFDWFSKERSSQIKFICTDMWKNFLNVVKDRAPNALNILDRFHIVKKINEAIDKVRNLEAKELKKKGKDIVLKNSRWTLLKRVENLTEKQSAKLKELLACNLKTIKAYLLKEEFDYFWQYSSATWASKFLKCWTTKVMRSKIEPMKAVAKTIRNHECLILNWFEAKGQLHLGAVEGLNNKLKSSIRNSYGIKTFKILEVMLYHRLGDLPVTEDAHKFFN
jgi:transposase